MKADGAGGALDHAQWRCRRRAAANQQRGDQQGPQAAAGEFSHAESPYFLVSGTALHTLPLQAKRSSG